MTGNNPVQSRTPLLDFVANILDEHWTRIGDLKINMRLLDSDHERIWQAFSRPAANLKTFSFTAFSNNSDYIEGVTQNLISPNFQLFSKHAPSLV